MLSYFFPANPAPATRIDSCDELKPISVFLTKLRKKELFLQEEKDKHPGADSLEFRKHLIIARLYKLLNDRVTAFNLLRTPPTKPEQIQLVRELAGHIQTIRTMYEMTLNTPRNQHRTIATTVATYSPYCLIPAAACMVSAPLILTAAMVYWGAPFLGNKAKQLTQLNSTDTATKILLDEFVVALDHMAKNLGLAQNWMDALEPANVDYPEAFNCLIAQEIMHDPVLCTLDGITYERDEIARWLTQHRTSPHNLKAMAPDQEVSAVLIENRNLKTIIEDYQKDNIEDEDEAYHRRPN